MAAAVFASASARVGLAVGSVGGVKQSLGRHLGDGWGGGRLSIHLQTGSPWWTAEDHRSLMSFFLSLLLISEEVEPSCQHDRTPPGTSE